ncbi:protein NDR1-like [Panicum virgatum]|uniref:Late embryogenesis abundant protein LEA-2 subgroup domain-containing protein n=1 Tax=Panicum virgatum TaxID=38727 RepID=A0A8T0N473_PANVG|nr:protein NDR1-like [Panicum virgatum]KAG2481187.1 hypothetical protein PVAP13_J683539 [Panicum virgatum]KAG2481194.1 hypothetical protein PVAP13_J684039 [Panicum virgatum]KAG2544280.1 hypothetical protein PVAP13_9KG014454 [Panicum virgatum]
MHQAGGTAAAGSRHAGRARDSCAAGLANTLCSLLLGLLLVAAVVLFVLWLGLRPHRPRFNIASFSVAGGLDPDSSPAGTSLAFNVTDRNPNRHIGIYYDAVHASVHFYDALVASGPAFAARWYQPNKTTTSITGFLDVLGPATTDASWPSFSAAVRAGRVPLRLQLATAIRFRVTNAFHSGRQRMHVSCDLLVGVEGNLLPESHGAACDRYF